MDIKKLKKSPIFNLSLSSKELFHSNFLAWIAEDEDTKDLFVSILKLFGLDNDAAEDYADGIRKGSYIVKREYNNFDFCICENIKNWDDKSPEVNIPGRVLLVLENKFKSIPYKAQLEEYQEKVKKLNEEGEINKAKSFYTINENKVPKRWSKNLYQKHLPQNEVTCHFVLLSLAEEVCGLSIEGIKPKRHIQTNNKWHFITYQEYSEKIKEQICGLLGFKYDVIRDYASYIDMFCEYLKKEIPNNILAEKWTSTLSPNSDLVAIRMDDIWQKLIANLIAVQFCNTSSWECMFGNDAEKLLNDENISNKVHVAAGFSRGTGLFEVKIKIDNGCLFGIQIQNGYYKRLLETTKKNLPDNAEKRFYKERIEKLKGMYSCSECQSTWSNPTNCNIFEPDGEIHPTDKRQNRVFENFGGYGNTFICQSKKLSSNSSIKDVLNAVTEDIKSVCNKLNISLV